MQPAGQQKHARAASINQAALVQQYEDNIAAAAQDSSDSGSDSEDDDSSDSESETETETKEKEAQPKKHNDHWAKNTFYQHDGKIKKHMDGHY